MIQSIRDCCAFPESQRDSITQPRVGPPRGTTLGQRSTNLTNPNGVESIPHIPFVEFDLVTAQQLPEFVLKRDLAMMFLLFGNVFAHGFNLRKADGENPITV